MAQISSEYYFKNSIYLALLLVFTSLLNAQDINKNYVIKKVSEINSYKTFDAQKDSLRDLSFKIVRLNADKGIPLYKTIDNLIVNEHLKSVYLIDWGVTESRSGNIERSKYLRKKGLNIATKYNNIPYVFKYYNALSNLYINVSQVDSATYYFKEAEKLVQLYPEELDYVSWTIHHRNYNIQKILGNFEAQDEAIELAWRKVSSFPNHSSQGFVLFLITDHFRKRKNYLKQSKYAELLIEYYNEKKISTPDYHFPVASVLIKSDSPEAIRDLERVVKVCDSLNNLNALSFTAYTLAEVFLDKNQYEKAIPILERTIFKLDSAKYLINNSSTHDLLQKAYAKKGNYKNAYLVLADQKILEDSLRSNEQLNKIADYEVKYQTQEKERKIEKQNANQKLLFWILGLGTILLISLSYFFIKNRKQNALLASQKQLLETTLDEKNLLLKEIHHRVKNSFQIVSSLLYLQSENAEDKEAKIAIKEAENRVRSMVLIHQKLYNKDALVGINTKEYFNDLVTDIFESHQYQERLIKYELNIDPLILDIETITPIGLILNELIVNTLKHAFKEVEAKSKLHINFAKENNTLVLKVKDNGKGFASEIKQTSFGITLMKALSKKLKASLHYNSELNQGTEAILNIKKFNILT